MTAEKSDIINISQIREGVIEKMKYVEWTSKVLVLVGALNWGLVGALDFNLVTTVLGEGTLTNVVYILVGVAALYEVYALVAKKEA